MVGASLSDAFINVFFAIITLETSFANARVLVESIGALSMVGTVNVSAFVHVNFAVCTAKTWFALANIIVNAVYAVTVPVGARFAFAFVVVNLAVCTAETRVTFARILVDAINAVASLTAHLSITLIHVHIARLTIVALKARAFETVDSIDTNALVLTGPGCTFIYVLLTVITL